MTVPVFCGDALCKKAVALPEGEVRWPVRCAACGTALYPADVLARLPPNEFEPKRGELMTERGGVRVPFNAPAHVAKPSAGGADDPADRILAMVEMDPAGAAAKKKRMMLVWIVAALVLAVVVALALAR